MTGSHDQHICPVCKRDAIAPNRIATHRGEHVEDGIRCVCCGHTETAPTRFIGATPNENMSRAIGP